MSSCSFYICSFHPASCATHRCKIPPNKAISGTTLLSFLVVLLLLLAGFCISCGLCWCYSSDWLHYRFFLLVFVVVAVIFPFIALLCLFSMLLWCSRANAATLIQPEQLNQQVNKIKAHKISFRGKGKKKEGDGEKERWGRVRVGRGSKTNKRTTKNNKNN